MNGWMTTKVHKSEKIECFQREFVGVLVGRYK